MRPRRVSQRTCIACRQTGAKQDLVRVVRTPQSKVCVDNTGKLSGRGAYLCKRESCLEKAAKQKKLTRALGVAVGDEVVEELRQRIGEGTALGHRHVEQGKHAGS